MPHDSTEPLEIETFRDRHTHDNKAIRYFLFILLVLSGPFLVALEIALR